MCGGGGGVQHKLVFRRLFGLGHRTNKPMREVN